MQHGPHKARKRFGQNFLQDANIISRIVRAIHPKTDDLMVEIGPGQGAITRELLESLQQLSVIELDRDLIPLLKVNLASQLDKLHIFSADALQFDFAQLIQNGQKLRVVGNLPYNISTPLIFHLLSYRQQLEDMHFMLQYEVVARMAAKPGSKTYGRLSIMSQYYCQVEHLFDVPPECFNPAPKVMSAIVRLKPYRQLPQEADDLPTFEEVVKLAFSQRRKMLRNTLKPLLSAEQIEQLEEDLKLRPEQLDISGFIRISNLIHQLRNSNSD